MEVPGEPMSADLMPEHCITSRHSLRPLIFKVVGIVLHLHGRAPQIAHAVTRSVRSATIVI